MEANQLTQISPVFPLVDNFIENDDGSKVEKKRRFEHASQADLKSEYAFYDFTKRTIDLIGAGALLAATTPVLGAIALTIRASSPGPVIFKQKRLTFGGKEFMMYKFRTMRQDAEAKSGPVWASSNDPRITKLGKFLRATRLDELPQLINVLTGDMSLIGPRPERPELVSNLEKTLPRFRQRLNVKAGLTGLAQVTNGYAANMSSYKKKLALDLLYVKKRSILLDLGIAAKTVMVVLTGKGAR